VGPDGRLRFIWHGPTPWQTTETEEPVGWPRAGFAWEGAISARA
jgi:hypothetical protein